MIKLFCDWETVKSGKKSALEVPANNFLFARRVPANNLFHIIKLQKVLDFFPFRKKTV